MDAIQRPVTYKAEQFDGKNDKAIEELLEGTNVRSLPRGNWAYLRLQFPPPPYETHGYVENGSVTSVWPDEWVVLSSTGVVRKLTAEAYDKEFYAEWEYPEDNETALALIAKYLYKLVNNADDNRLIDVDPGDWSKLENIRDRAWG